MLGQLRLQRAACNLDQWQECQRTSTRGPSRRNSSSCQAIAETSLRKDSVSAGGCQQRLWPYSHIQLTVSDPHAESEAPVDCGSRHKLLGSDQGQAEPRATRACLSSGSSTLPMSRKRPPLRRSSTRPIPRLRLWRRRRAQKILGPAVGLPSARMPLQKPAGRTPTPSTQIRSRTTLLPLPRARSIRRRGRSR